MPIQIGAFPGLRQADQYARAKITISDNVPPATVKEVETPTPHPPAWLETQDTGQKTRANAAGTHYGQAASAVNSIYSADSTPENPPGTKVQVDGRYIAHGIVAAGNGGVPYTQVFSETEGDGWTQDGWVVTPNATAVWNIAQSFFSDVHVDHDVDALTMLSEISLFNGGTLCSVTAEYDSFQNEWQVTGTRIAFLNGQNVTYQVNDTFQGRSLSHSIGNTIKVNSGGIVVIKSKIIQATIRMSVDNYGGIARSKLPITDASVRTHIVTVNE